MSIYALIEYVEDCKKAGVEPTWDGLKMWKELEWAD